MKLTTERLKRLIKEEIEAVMQEEDEAAMQEDKESYNISMQQMKKIMSHGLDRSKIDMDNYPLTRKAAFAVVDGANLSVDDEDAAAKALQIKGNFFDAMQMALVNYAVATSRDDKQAAMKIQNQLSMPFQQSLKSIVQDNPNKRGFFQKAGSFLRGKGFKE